MQTKALNPSKQIHAHEKVENLGKMSKKMRLIFTADDVLDYGGKVLQIIK